MRYASACLVLALTTLPAAGRPPSTVTGVPPAVVPPIPVPVINMPVPSPPPNIRKLPQARRAAQSYVTAADYPESALTAREQGRVRMLLGVNADGRAAACTITISSGSTALDGTSCRILLSRARFTPAIDDKGKATRFVISQEVNWKLPN